jgi:hypothetical protein
MRFLTETDFIEFDGEELLYCALARGPISIVS